MRAAALLPRSFAPALRNAPVAPARGPLAAASRELRVPAQPLRRAVSSAPDDKPKYDQVYGRPENSFEEVCACARRRGRRARISMLR
jgi:hypothetical protein